MTKIVIGFFMIKINWCISNLRFKTSPLPSPMREGI
jgi:hypothetical protein